MDIKASVQKYADLYISSPMQKRWFESQAANHDDKDDNAQILRLLAAIREKSVHTPALKTLESLCYAPEPDRNALWETACGLYVENDPSGSVKTEYCRVRDYIAFIICDIWNMFLRADMRKEDAACTE